MKICVVGIGLIGGSILKGLVDDSYERYGYDQSTDVMKMCYKEGLILNQEEPDWSEMDIVFVCLYPEATIHFIKTHMVHFKADAIITDVAGLKVAMMASLKSYIRDDIHFIGGHPMAGREGSGFLVSSSDIFKGANYLLVENDVPKEMMEQLYTIIESLGCGHIEVMEAWEHDEIIAFTSHMPHILSTAYMRCDRFDRTRHCIAGSFKDVTRVADINEVLWAELILNNREPVLSEIEYFEASLKQLKNQIQQRDRQGIEAFLHDAGVKKRNL